MSAPVRPVDGASGERDPSLAGWTRRSALAAVLALGGAHAAGAEVEGYSAVATAAVADAADSATVDTAAVAPATVTPDAPPIELRQSEVEEVVVTGSRIGRNNLDGPGPLNIVSSDDLKLSGNTNLDDYLRKLPSLGFGGTNSQSNNAGAGFAFIELRNLGPQRTLVLLDGHRAPGNDGPVDINTVPSALVDRVEVLRDGASAVYGSDAIGGVINFVLRDDFDGVELEALNGVAGAGDGRELGLSLTAGKNFSRGNLVFNVNSFDRNTIRQKDRRFSRREITGVSPDGRPTFGSSSIVEGRVEGQFFRPDAATGKSFQAFNSMGLDQRFNFAKDQFLVPPTERYSFNLLGKYDVSDSVQAFLQSTVTMRDSEQMLASTPLGNATFKNQGGFRIPFSQAPQDFQDAVRGGDVMIAGLDPAMLGPDATLPVFRRLEEAGPRLFQQDADSFRVVTGLKGELPGPLGAWKWDTFFNYGRTDNRQQTKNSINLTKAIIAADPERCAQTPGCVPGNFLGKNSLSPGTVKFIRYDEQDKTRFRLSNFGASASGPIYELPAGPAQLALGLEYREESGFSRPDRTKVAGDSANNQVTPTRGDFNVREAFFELEVPLLRSRPFLEDLTANIAGRLTDYNTFGSDYQYRYALTYAPSSQVKLRGTVSTSFRAPSIGDLFGGNADGFPVLDDPCNGLDAMSNAVLVANCRMSGVPDGFVQRDSQIRTTAGGNPNLDAEKSDFFGLGLVFTPSFVDDLSFTVDYYDISVDNAIIAPDPQFTLDSCFRNKPGLTDPACANITRQAGSGAISGLQANLANLGTLKTRGLDFELNYGRQLPVLGAMKLSTQATYLMKFERDELSGKRELQGTITPTDGGLPRLKGAINGSFTPTDKMLLNLNMQYIGRADTDDTVFDHVSAFWYLDTAMRYNLSEAWTLTLGVRNVTDKQPPRLINMANSDGSVYDFAGRFAFARFNARF